MFMVHGGLTKGGPWAPVDRGSIVSYFVKNGDFIISRTTPYARSAPVLQLYPRVYQREVISETRERV